jgi:hypothetical protein
VDNRRVPPLKAYEITVKKMENVTVYYKETEVGWHLIFCLGSRRRDHRHIAKPEPNRRVTIDRVPLLVLP